jgi:hypothetical protein
MSQELQSGHAAPEAAPDRAAPTSFDCTVVVPLFNKGAYVERALKSALAQTLPPAEIIVVDDGSTDDGPAKVATLARTHPTIRLIRRDNAGVSAARNLGIREARTRWVAFLDADDGYLPWLLAELATLARRFPAAALLGAQFREVGPDFDLVGEARRDIVGRVERRQLASFYDRWWRGTPFFTSSSVARRADLEALGEPFPVKERRAEDLDLFFRLAERAPVAWTARVSAVYAIGVAGSLTSSGAELVPAPAFARLRQRALGGDVPLHELLGALRCTATYWMTVARRRIRVGDLAGAMALLRDPVTAHRPVYWVRTLALLALAGARARLTTDRRRRPSSCHREVIHDQANEPLGLDGDDWPCIAPADHRRSRRDWRRRASPSPWSGLGRGEPAGRR